MEAGQIAKDKFLLRDVLLRPGKYFIGLWLGREAIETIDDLEHATTLDFAEGEENSRHFLVYPGYLCRFDEHISIHQLSVAGTALS